MSKKRASTGYIRHDLLTALEDYLDARHVANEALLELVERLKADVAEMSRTARPVHGMEERINELRARTDGAEAAAEEAYGKFVEAWQAFRKEVQEATYD